VYELHSDSSDVRGRNLGKYKKNAMPSVGGPLDRTLTSHFLFRLQGANNCSYVTEQCYLMWTDYLRKTRRREDYNE
jgi:hypothetical protein